MSKNSSDVVITSALRTPIGRYKGSLKNLSASKLGSIAIKEVIYKSKLDLEEIDEVIMGHVLTSGLGQNPARQASIGAGVPVSKPAHIVNQVCGSGLRSVVSGYQSISLGENKIVIAGGQENMSRATHAIYYREDKKFSENKLVDTMIKDGLLDSFNDYHMGVTAENVAEKYKISRDEQDNFSLNSQKKTEKAYSENKFKDELIKLQIEDGDKKFIFEKDEHPRENLSIDDLKKLKTVFKENGTVTPGNSSGINDGAAALLLTSLEQAEKKELELASKSESVKEKVASFRKIVNNPRALRKIYGSDKQIVTFRNPRLSRKGEYFQTIIISEGQTNSPLKKLHIGINPKKDELTLLSNKEKTTKPNSEDNLQAILKDDKNFEVNQSENIQERLDKLDS